MSHIGSEDINSHDVVVEDCTVIYIRSHFGRNYRGSKIVIIIIIIPNINYSIPSLVACYVQAVSSICEVMGSAPEATL